jgi:hypothetical protein
MYILLFTTSILAFLKLIFVLSKPKKPELHSMTDWPFPHSEAWELDQKMKRSRKRMGWVFVLFVVLLIVLIGWFAQKYYI